MVPTGESRSQRCSLSVKDRFNRNFIFILTDDTFPESDKQFVEPIILSAVGGRAVEGVELIAEGSYNKIFRFSHVVGRFTPISCGEKFLRRVSRGISTAKVSGLMDVLASGEVFRENQASPLGHILFMNLMSPLTPSFIDEESIWRVVQSISKNGFHNDFKFDNLLLSLKGDVQAIDFDYFHESRLIISLSSFQTIEVYLGQFLSSLDDPSVVLFRSFYDYTYLSASLGSSSPLYPKILSRLEYLFSELEKKNILTSLIAFLTPAKIRDIPFEVLVRCPEVDAVSVHLLDLKGNAFAHRRSDWDNFPSIFKSNGVYWPDR